MIDLTNGQVRVARDVLDWLDDQPGEKEIEDYVSTVMRSNPDALIGVYIFAPEILHKKKQAYFSELGAEVFLKTLSELDQLRYISALTRYSVSSVKEKIQKQFQIVLPDLPATINEWAAEYMSVWDGVLTVWGYEDYTRKLQYLRSFLKIPATPDQLTGISEGCVKSLEVLRRRFFRDLPATREELDEERTALALVPFFPEEFITNELRKADDPVKKRLFEDMHLVATLMLSMQGQDATSIELTLKELVKGEKERALLAELESFRKRDYPEANTSQVFFDIFDNAFTIENIRSQAVSGAIRSGAAAITIGPEFIGALYAYIRKNPLIQTIIDPYDIDFILEELANLKVETDIPVFLKEVEINLETSERKKFFLPLMHDLFAITHTYKQ